jgi:hypothetical protein
MATFVHNNIKWIMIITGLLTFSMIYAAISPDKALTGMFGAAVDGPGSQIVVRNWGFLIALAGLMLIYGAFVQTVRSFVLVVVGVSKIIFITLVLTLGQSLMNEQLALSISVDSIIVLLFCIYLAKEKQSALV